eukprot:1914909-Heterocapsa_arctica.AAC.1
MPNSEDNGPQWCQLAEGSQCTLAGRCNRPSPAPPMCLRRESKFGQDGQEMGCHTGWHIQHSP